MKRSDEERIKLRATFVNSVAIAILVVGVLAPVAALIYGTAPVDSVSFVLFGATLCTAVSYALHLLAIRYLKGLDHDDGD